MLAVTPAIAITAATTYFVIAFIILYFDPEPILVHLLAIYLAGFIVVVLLIFQSIGKAIQAFLTSVSRTALFLLSLTASFWQLDGVWLAFLIAEVLVFLLALALLLPQIRDFRRKNANKDQLQNFVQTEFLNENDRYKEL